MPLCSQMPGQIGGIGQTGVADGEVCFNTAMTGYQEILTDPSYAGQIVTFTFPHIGNVGTNDEDLESLDDAPASGVRGAVIASAVTNPSNWRSSRHLDGWLKARGIVGITGIDTRALTALIRDRGMPNAVIANDPEGKFDREALKARAAALAPMEGLDLVLREPWHPLLRSTRAGRLGQRSPLRRLDGQERGERLRAELARHLQRVEHALQFIGQPQVRLAHGVALLPDAPGLGDAAHAFGVAAAQAAQHRRGERGARLALGQDVIGPRGACAKLRVELACMRLSDGKPDRIPPRWRSVLSALRDAGAARGA